MSISLEQIERIIQARKAIVAQAERRAYETQSPQDQEVATAQMHKLDGLLSAVPRELKTEDMLSTPLSDVIVMSPRLIEAKANKAREFLQNR